MRETLGNPNLQIDPRPIGIDGLVYEIAYAYYADHTIATITLVANYTGDEEFWDWEGMQMYFRVYNPAIETVPESFDSTTYRYFGIEHETAPSDTVEVIIDVSVTTIRGGAFLGCREMKVCKMHNDVEIIGNNVFEGCTELKTIKLSTNLRHIGFEAFKCCYALDAVFVPPSVQRIGGYAFSHCTSLVLLSLPMNITTRQIGPRFLDGCENFFNATQIQEYEPHRRNQRRHTNGDDSGEVHESILAFYDHVLPPLYQVCLDTNISAQTVHECIRANGRVTSQATATYATNFGNRTPLHVLTMNPYANMAAILACFNLNIGVAFERDDAALNPIDYIWMNENVEQVTCLRLLIQALCIRRESVRQAAMSPRRISRRVRRRVN